MADIHLNERQVQQLARAIAANLADYGSALHRGWLSVASAAKYSDFSISAIESAVRTKQLRSKQVAITGGGKRKCRRIKREWLDAWIEEQPDPEA